MKFPYYLIVITECLELQRYELAPGKATPTVFNNYTSSTKGCPCFYDSDTKDCPCCKDENACPCSWPYNDRCGDCTTGHGCVPEPINKLTISDRGCRCQDTLGDPDRTCACCFPSKKNTCPCAFPYHHMCGDCDEADSCGGLDVVTKYKKSYPNYFVEEEEYHETRSMELDWNPFQGNPTCEELPNTLDNGFVLCDKEPKSGKACAWFCEKGFELVGAERAECICFGGQCYWNDNANFQSPNCKVNRCLTDPCGPGVCIESGNGEEYSCACPDGYSGEQCEEFEFGDSQLFADDSGFSDLINNRQDQSDEIFSSFGDDFSEFSRSNNRVSKKRKKQCLPLSDGGLRIKNGELVCTNGYKSKSICQLKCVDGFEVSNRNFASPICNCNKSRCFWDSKRNFEIAKCDWPLPIGDNVNDAYYDGSDFDLETQTKTDDIIRGSKQVENSNCMGLVSPKFGSMRCSESTQEGSTCRFKCKKGYSLSAEMPATCLCENGSCHWNKIPEYHEPICEDLDECELNLNNCDQTNTTCINKPGSYVCLKNESPLLRECDDKPCGRGGICKITANGYRCRCKDGFRVSNRTCKDINECFLNIHKCFDEAICENEIGTYSCRCPSGYGDGITQCLDDRSQLACIRKRSLIFDPLPNYVAPNACCQGIAFNTDLKCCCNDRIYNVDDCPCLKIEYTELL